MNYGSNGPAGRPARPASGFTGTNEWHTPTSSAYVYISLSVLPSYWRLFAIGTCRGPPSAPSAPSVRGQWSAEQSAPGGDWQPKVRSRSDVLASLQPLPAGPPESAAACSGGYPGAAIVEQGRAAEFG